MDQKFLIEWLSHTIINMYTEIYVSILDIKLDTAIFPKTTAKHFKILRHFMEFVRFRNLWLEPVIFTNNVYITYYSIVCGLLAIHVFATATDILAFVDWLLIRVIRGVIVVWLRETHYSVSIA